MELPIDVTPTHVLKHHQFWYKVLQFCGEIRSSVSEGVQNMWAFHATTTIARARKKTPSPKKQKLLKQT